MGWHLAAFSHRVSAADQNQQGQNHTQLVPRDPADDKYVESVKWLDQAVKFMHRKTSIRVTSSLPHFEWAILKHRQPEPHFNARGTFWLTPKHPLSPLYSRTFYLQGMLFRGGVIQFVLFALAAATLGLYEKKHWTEATRIPAFYLMILAGLPIDAPAEYWMLLLRHLYEHMEEQMSIGSAVHGVSNRGYPWERRKSVRCNNSFLVSIMAETYLAIALLDPQFRAQLRATSINDNMEWADTRLGEYLGRPLSAQAIRDALIIAREHPMLRDEKQTHHYEPLKDFILNMWQPSSSRDQSQHYRFIEAHEITAQGFLLHGHHGPFGSPPSTKHAPEWYDLSKNTKVIENMYRQVNWFLSEERDIINDG